MRIAIFGGTFNPLHNGHALVGDVLSCEMKFDKVLFVPTGQPPHKIEQSTIPAKTRLDMVQQFCYTNPCFQCEDCEVSKGGISYTIDTVHYLMQKYPGADFTLVMGQDVAQQFPKWKSSSEIAEICHFLIAARELSFVPTDFCNKPCGEYVDPLLCTDKPFFLADAEKMDNPVLSVSSSEIRYRIANSKAWRYMVPEPIYRYIVENHLYGYSL